jgi:hypothetical protein
MRRFYSWFLPTVLISVTVANVAVTTTIQSVANQPIRTHSDPSLTYLSHVEQGTVDRRYSFFMELGDVAAGDTLMVHENSGIELHSAESLSRVIVRQADYDPAAVFAAAGDLGEPLGVLEVGDTDLPYWIIPGEGHRWWLGRTERGIVVLQIEDLPNP